MRAMFRDAPRPIPTGYETPPAPRREPTTVRPDAPPRATQDTVARRNAMLDADAARRLEEINAANRAFYNPPRGTEP